MKNFNTEWLYTLSPISPLMTILATVYLYVLLKFGAYENVASYVNLAVIHTGANTYPFTPRALDLPPALRGRRSQHVDRILYCWWKISRRHISAVALCSRRGGFSCLFRLHLIPSILCTNLTETWQIRDGIIAMLSATWLLYQWLILTPYWTAMH